VECNHVALCGRISEIAPLRYTPGGLPILTFTLSHDSEQAEAGQRRKVQCEVPVMAVADAAEAAGKNRIGDLVEITGFMAQKSRTSYRLVLHVKSIRLIERG
jgi:primosomal replication protein N